MFNHRQKLILCVTNQSLTAGLWQGAHLQSYKTFGNTDEDHTIFSQYLAQYPGMAIYLIADVVEEDYKLEALPHTTGNARRQILARKLSQFSRNSIYRTAHFIKRDSGKRRDDNFLFVALSKAEFLKSWMDVIQATHAPLVGVYLLPMISQVMIRQMKLMAPNILFCERLSSGLRQTFLHNGRLRMSRLSPMHAVKANQVNYFYLTEIEKTRLYLLSRRLIVADTALQMVLPVFDSTHEDVANIINQDQGYECKTVDILAYAKNSRLKRDDFVAHPELLHMQLLANGNVPDNLAPSTLTKTHNLNKVSRNINIATIVFAALGVLLATFYFIQGYMHKSKVSDIDAQTKQQQLQYEMVAKNFPNTPVPGDDLKTAVEIAEIIQTNNRTPQQFMQVLSSAFKASPEIALSRMRWVQSSQVDIEDEGLNKTVENNQNSLAGNPTKLLQIGFINAEIRDFNGDYRQALESVSRFAAHLRANPEVQHVLVLQEPVNVSSFANLQGSTTDESETKQRAPAIFKLKVVLDILEEGAAQ